MTDCAENLFCLFPPADPLIRALAKDNYYSKSTLATWGGIVPLGMPGDRLLALANTLKADYRRVCQGDPEAEVIRRGAA